MANEDFPRLDQKLGDSPVKKGFEADYMNRELVPVVRRLIDLVEAFMSRPQLPIRDTTSGVTDALLDEFGDDPVRDGCLIVSESGQVYVRVSGSWQLV